MDWCVYASPSLVQRRKQQPQKGIFLKGIYSEKFLNVLHSDSNAILELLLISHF